MISIIIRTKNEALMLGQVLKQVFNQDSGDVEVIVVDSGSEDTTLTIARQYPTHIITIPPERFTFGYALNVAARAAHGKYLVALSAHAVPANRRWLAELIRPLTHPDVAAASSRQIPHPGQRLETYLAFWQMIYSLHICTPTVYRYLFSNACSVFRASLWQRCPFDEKMASCEDHYWALQMQQWGYRIAYAPKSVVFHSHNMPLLAKWGREWQEIQALRKLYGQYKTH